MDRDELRVPVIVLEWSERVPWNDLKVNARSAGGIRLSQASGVYEVRRFDAEERLTIGRAVNLLSRVKQGLVKGYAPHKRHVAKFGRLPKYVKHT